MTISQLRDDPVPFKKGGLLDKLGSLLSNDAGKKGQNKETTRLFLKTSSHSLTGRKVARPPT